MAADLRPIARALLSVTDKTGLAELAASLARHGVELVSTGGTADVLRKAGFAITDVSALTGFPEIMDGRVKTLHPKIHGGLLSVRDNAAHEQQRLLHAIPLIDLLVVNLYAFEAALARGATPEVIVENIDIGGPAMIRSAAKNHESVAVLTDLADYAGIARELDACSGALSFATRRRLAAKAFACTAAYDSAIATWFADVEFPETLTLAATRVQKLRYGENPHQQAAAYRLNDGRKGLLDAEQVQGKELSYNNLNDADAALEALLEFPRDEAAACVIVKHANPCGVATGATILAAYLKALRCDPVSAFGGVIAFNRGLDGETAAQVSKLFTEVILAPGADTEARSILAAKKNLRLLLLPEMFHGKTPSRTVKSIAGGLLVQSRDATGIDEASLICMTKRQPTEPELRDLGFAWRVAKHVKSNAIVFAKDGATVGIGAGQMSRIDSTRIAARKSLDAAEALGLRTALSQGAVLASDAFFPFADGLEAAAEAGASAIIQPGGAMRDVDVIAAADRLGLAMVFTGQRHFRH